MILAWANCYLYGCQMAIFYNSIIFYIFQLPFYCKEEPSLLIYVFAFIHLYQYEFMDSYFVHCITIIYLYCLFDTQFVINFPGSTPSHWLLCPFEIFPSFFKYFLTCWHKEVFLVQLESVDLVLASAISWRVSSSS